MLPLRVYASCLQAAIIAEQESILGLHSQSVTGHGETVAHVEEVQRSLAPMLTLWNSAKEFLEAHAGWMDTPLLELDATAAMEDALTMLQRVQRIVAELETVYGDARSIPHSVAQALQVRSGVLRMTRQANLTLLI